MTAADSRLGQVTVVAVYQPRSPMLGYSHYVFARRLLAALALLLIAGFVAQSATASIGRDRVLVGGRYRPTRNWCPTNRTCFARITWTTYNSTRAVGHGQAKDCAGGGGPCQTSEQTVTLDQPRVLCGHREFSRLRMFGRVFHAGAAPVLCSIYY
jgi:hypothetical protein